MDGYEAQPLLIILAYALESAQFPSHETANGELRLLLGQRETDESDSGRQLTKS